MKIERFIVKNINEGLYNRGFRGKLLERARNKVIMNLIKALKNEITTTSNVAGYTTPYAFAPNKKVHRKFKKKVVKGSGYDDVETATKKTKNFTSNFRLTELVAPKNNKSKKKKRIQSYDYDPLLFSDKNDIDSNNNDGNNNNNDDEEVVTEQQREEVREMIRKNIMNPTYAIDTPRINIGESDNNNSILPVRKENGIPKSKCKFLNEIINATQIDSLNPLVDKDKEV